MKLLTSNQNFSFPNYFCYECYALYAIHVAFLIATVLCFEINSDQFCEFETTLETLKLLYVFE